METEEDMIVVEADGLPGIGEEVRIYTYLQVREDAMSLYGFLTRQDLKMFRQLLGVNGIGPRGALGLLSALRPDDLRLAIISGDVKAISRAPGIGSKTAQRLILDLKDRISVDEMIPHQEAALEAKSRGGLGEAGNEAVSALVALGYSAMEASRAVRQVEITESMTTEDVLKASLKYMAF